MIGEYNTYIDNKSLPKHESIGKNGSFWLPKGSKVGSVDKPNLAKKDSSKYSNVKSGKGLISDNKAPAKEPIIKKVPSSFAKTILSASQSKSTNSTNSEGKSSFLKQQVNTSTVKLVSKPIVIKQPKQLMHAAKSIANGTNLKDEFKLSLNLNTVFKSSVSKDPGERNQQQKDANHGAKNAKSFSVDSEKIEILTHSDFEQRTPPTNPSVAKIVNFVSHAILPRLAYLDKFSKKILRFALDLPNGDKLGIRLEKSGQAISLCLIAPKSSLRDIFDFCKNQIASELKSSENNDLSIHVFTDYGEMDRYFSKVA